MSRLPLVAALGIAAAAAAASVPLLAHGSPAAASAPRACSADTLPEADKAAMEQEYARRSREDGQAAADAWLRNEARVFLARLVAEGVCTMDSPPPPTATASRAPAKAPLGKDGKPCKRTRTENRAVANVSGGPMTMVLVPVCAD